MTGTKRAAAMGTMAPNTKFGLGYYALQEEPQRRRTRPSTYISARVDIHDAPQRLEVIVALRQPAQQPALLLGGHLRRGRGGARQELTRPRHR
jgi:hypothetical protein